MKITLPIVEKKYDELANEVVINKSNLVVNVNNNFQAHLRYEELFQTTTGIDLTTHTGQVANWIKDPEIAKTKLMDMLKILFCFIDSKEVPSFNDFLGMLEHENSEEVIEKITKVIELSHSTASKN